MATLADVARRAGVSQATASRIISGSTKLVTDELRGRVLRAVEELQYVPNAHAQLLARTQRTTVGVIVHDVSVHESHGVFWAAPPSKPMVGRDGTHMRDASGKPRYSPIIAFATRDRRDAFSSAVIEALRAQRPKALR